jgi:predicted permease
MEDLRIWLRRGLPFVEQIRQDVHFGFRQLCKSPGFALTAILTLALGLGANTAVFSLINGLLLRPLPVPLANDLALVRMNSSDGGLSSTYTFSALTVRALERQLGAFQSVAGFTNEMFQVRSASGNLAIPGALVSGQFFAALQTPPLLGRYLTVQDDQPGGTSTGFDVVISESFWRSWFNSAPDVVGQRITIANAPFTVVGVMPKRFIGADPTRQAKIYAPLWAEPLIDVPYNRNASGFRWLRVIGRRKSGITLEQANGALGAATNSILEEASANSKSGKGTDGRRFLFAADPGSRGYSRLRDMFQKPLAAVFILCAVMLLLACLNLASLLMARSAARERELATRVALGATRRRLIQQLLIESSQIAVLGTMAGMVAAPFVSKLLAAFIVAQNRGGESVDTSLDMRVFAFVTLTVVIATLLVGLIPAVRATGDNLNEQIKSGSHTLSARLRRRLLPQILMGLEVALALILVIGGGLLATSLTRLYRTGVGFETKGIVNLDLDMGKQGLESDSLLRWYQEFGNELRRLPGVENVSYASNMPLAGHIWTEDYRTPVSTGDREVMVNGIAPEYFQTMRIPILVGRDFQWNDTSASGRKIILSQTATRYLFPGQIPIGKHVTSNNKDYEVVGVVGDIRYVSIREPLLAGAYLPITQSEDRKQSYTAVLRIHGSPMPLASAARSLAAQMASEIPSPVMTTLSDELDASISSERMIAMLAVLFATCALLVSAIGLYGTLAYATEQRRSEIGIRIALGAQRLQVVGLVFGENVRIAAGGSMLGLIGALFASRVLASFLYGTSTHDPLVLVASGATLTLVASAASIMPAIRAARIEPTAALRSE